MGTIARRLNKFWFILKNRGPVYLYNYLWVYALYYNENIRDFVAKYLPFVYNSSPQTVEIEVTTRCGLRCKMCEHTYWKQDQCEMSFDSFKKIIDDLPRLKWIGLTGIGDSFSHKDFLNMLSYVKKRNIYVELFDTYFNLNEKAAQTLVNLKIDKMIASIDGATAETYEKIRVGSNFNRITGNIKKLIDLRKAQKTRFPEMSFHFIVSKINIHEMVQYVDFINTLMEGESVEIFYTKLLHPFNEIKDIAADIPEELIKAVEARGRELGQITRWNVNVPEEKKPINCCRAWMIPFIFATGDVIPCCAGNEANQREFQVKTSLGNVYKERFADIWRGEKYINFRKEIFAGKTPTACKFCTIYDISKK